MFPDVDDHASPAEMARMLAAQAELLALNAAIESARGGSRGTEFQRLAEQAQALAERGREIADRHEAQLSAQESVGRLLDEGLAGAPAELDAIDHFLLGNARHAFAAGMVVAGAHTRHH